MACRICKDPPTAGVNVKQHGTKAEDLILGLVEVGDIEIQMKLLRVPGVGPPWGSVILHTLEPVHEARVGVKGRKILADSPSGIGLIDHPAQEPFRHITFYGPDHQACEPVSPSWPPATTRQLPRSSHGLQLHSTRSRRW